MIFVFFEKHPWGHDEWSEAHAVTIRVCELWDSKRERKVRSYTDVRFSERLQFVKRLWYTRSHAVCGFHDLW